MFTVFKTAAIVATTVIAAHAAIGFSAGSAMQNTADVAMMPIVKAEKIVVNGKALQIVKADKITITAKPIQIVKAEKITVTATKAQLIALTSWNRAA
jgi:hypothetical protein